MGTSDPRDSEHRRFIILSMEQLGSVMEQNVDQGGMVGVGMGMMGGMGEMMGGGGGAAMGYSRGPRAGGALALAPGQRYDTQKVSGKLFLGGLDLNTTKEALQDYCAQW